GGGPGVEGVVVVGFQVRLVVEEVGAGVAVGGDDGVVVGHGVTPRVGKSWSVSQCRPTSRERAQAASTGNWSALWPSSAGVGPIRRASGASAAVSKPKTSADDS